MARSLPPIPNLSRLEIAVTVELYDALTATDEEYIRPSDLYSKFKPLQGGIVGRLAERANESGYYSLDAEGDYRITSYGVDLILNGLVDKDSAVQKYLEHGMQWVLGEAVAQSAPRIEDLPWEPIKLDRDSVEFSEAVQATKEALKQIESSNGFSSEYPEERDAIVLAIRGNLDVLEQGTLTDKIIKYGLISPLKFVATKFAGASIGEIAKFAIAALFKLLSGG